METVNPNLKVRRSEIPGSKVDDEIVFFNPDSGKYYGTGRVGAAIWDMLDEPKALTEIYDSLLEIYDVDRATCEGHVNEFVGTMLTEGVLLSDN